VSVGESASVWVIAVTFFVRKFEISASVCVGQCDSRFDCLRLLAINTPQSSQWPTSPLLCYEFIGPGFKSSVFLVLQGKQMPENPKSRLQFETLSN